MRALLSAVVLFSLSASAQTASDFTITDVDGVERNLFSELNNDKIVVLKFFTNWCTICNNTADEVVAIYNDYQTNSDPVVFWALDRDQNETNADATSYRNNNNIPFPVIGEAYPIAQQFGVVYQPEYYIVRPDRSYVKRTNFSSMETAVDEALEALNALGIEDELKKANLRVTERSITWLKSVNETAELQIFDASGRMVLDRRISGQETINLELSTGVYIYRVSADGSTFTGKIGLAQ